MERLEVGEHSSPSKKKVIGKTTAAVALGPAAAGIKVKVGTPTAVAVTLGRPRTPGTVTSRNGEAKRMKMEEGPTMEEEEVLGRAKIGRRRQKPTSGQPQTLMRTMKMTGGHGRGMRR